MYVQHKQDEDYFNVWDKYLAGLSSILIYGQFLLQKKAYLHFELGGGAGNEHCRRVLSMWLVCCVGSDGLNIFYCTFNTSS